MSNEKKLIPAQEVKKLQITFENEDDFLKIKETLTRIGIANKRDKTLYQTCHILHKAGKYYIVHFKEMFLLDGRRAEITEEDIVRRDRIAQLLEDWGLCEIVNPEVMLDSDIYVPFHVVKYAEKGEWNLVPKYHIGNKSRKAA